MKKYLLLQLLILTSIFFVSCGEVPDSSASASLSSSYQTVSETNSDSFAEYSDLSEQSTSSSNQNSTPFTNKFGTPTTKCAHSGCNNFIASSGDTNCCVTHSNKCLECNKYIDEDALYCMDCINNAGEQVKESSSSFTNKYGTPTTKCAHSGCDNYIASSGDTNCCITHSNKCLECNKYIDEDALYCMDCINKAGEQAKDSISSFTNKYGTPTTKCAHSGCNNYIASSGDTNCCTTHSNKCLECNKYIDEDAMYCMDCLTKASNQTIDQSNSYNNSNLYDSGNSYGSSGGYDQPKEGESFSDYVQRVDPELYNSLFE